MGAESAPGDGPAPGVPFAGVDVDEWDALVGRGRRAGAVHAEDVAHVLRHVELSGDVLTEVQIAMAGHGHPDRRRRRPHRRRHAVGRRRAESW